MISGNLKIMDVLAGITAPAETALLPGNSEALENSDEGFAGIFAQVVNGVDGLVPQVSDLTLPMVENSIAGEIEPSQIFESTTDGTASAAMAELPVSPKSKSPVNMGTIEILNSADTQLPILPILQSPVNIVTNEIFNPVKSQLSAMPKTKTQVRNEAVDILNQSNAVLAVDSFKSPFEEPDFVNAVKPEGKVQSSAAHMPMITIEGRAVSGVVNLPGPTPALFANDIYARLNLKEIHIKSDKAIESPIEIVNGSMPSQSFAPKLEIEEGDTKAPPKPLAAKAELVQDIIESGYEPETGDNLSKNHSQAPVELKTEEGELLSAKVKTSEKFEPVLVNEKSTVQSNIEQKANIGARIWTGTESDQTPADIKPHQSVKIILPEQTKLSGDNRNHSMVIKIEPEHLGPARLDLHLRNEILTAKLTVETPAAKTTLENSLNSLKEQFAKADIKVENIEINVRGETNYNQLFERQPQWQKFNSAHQNRFNAGDFLEPFVPVEQINNFSQQQYVGSGGVNILA